MNNQELSDYLKQEYSNRLKDIFVDKGHCVAKVAVGEIAEVCALIKADNRLKFDLLMDLTVVDWLPRKPRFDLVYHFYSVEFNHRLRIKAALDDGQPAPTLTKLWPIADWLEREMWDLYGIKFSGHPNLKRLLMYEEFKGHPLRKDYPYDKRQPLEPETWPVRSQQVRIEGLKIHRP